MIDIILYALWVDEEYSFIYLLFSSLLFSSCVALTNLFISKDSKLNQSVNLMHVHV